MITLDEYTQERGLRPEFLKIDVQGYELEALKGGQQSFRPSRSSSQTLTTSRSTAAPRWRRRSSIGSHTAATRSMISATSCPGPGMARCGDPT